jgi:hypothetical protein
MRDTASFNAVLLHQKTTKHGFDLKESKYTTKNPLTG